MMERYVETLCRSRGCAKTIGTLARAYFAGLNHVTDGKGPTLSARIARMETLMYGVSARDSIAAAAVIAELRRIESALAGARSGPSRQKETHL